MTLEVKKQAYADAQHIVTRLRTEWGLTALGSHATNGHYRERLTKPAA